MAEVIELSYEYVADRLDHIERIVPGLVEAFAEWRAADNCQCCFQYDFCDGLDLNGWELVREWGSLRFMAGEHD